METRVSEKNQKWIKIGILWNGLTLLMVSSYNAVASIQNGASISQSLFSFILYILMGGIVLYLNIYAFRIVLTQNTRQAANMALIMACISILSLNIVGSLIIILSYLRVRKYDIPA